MACIGSSITVKRFSDRSLERIKKLGGGNRRFKTEMAFQGEYFVETLWPATGPA